MEVPTIKIKSAAHPDGYVVINEGDFDASTMERWYEPGEEPPAAAPTPSGEGPAAMTMPEPPVMVKVKAADMPEGYKLMPADQYDPMTMQMWEEPPTDASKSASPGEPSGDVSEPGRRRRGV